MNQYYVELEVIVRRIVIVEAESEKRALDRAWVGHGKDLGKWRPDEIVSAAIKPKPEIRQAV